MAIRGSGIVSTGIFSPVIIPYGRQSSGSSNSDMYRALNYADRQDKNAAKDDVLEDILKIKALPGAREILAFQRRYIDTEGKNIKQKALQQSINGDLSPSQYNDLYQQFRKEKAQLEEKKINYYLSLPDAERDLKYWEEDRKRVFDDNKYGAPKLNIDYGRITIGDSGQTDDVNLFMNSQNGVVASNRNGFMTNDDYLQESEKSIGMDENGLPKRYMPLIQSEKDDVYLANLGKRISEAGTISGESILTNEGKQASLQDISEFMSGGGFIKSSSSSNASNVKLIVDQMPNLLSPAEMNTAAERLISTNAAVATNDKPFIIKHKIGDKEYEQKFSGTYGELSDAMANEYSLATDKTLSTDERRLHQMIGIAYAKRFNEGVNAQILKDAINQSRGKIKGESTIGIVRNTEGYNKNFGVSDAYSIKRSIVGLSKSTIKATQDTYDAGLTVFDKNRNNVAYNIAGEGAKTKSNILQDDIVKTYFGLPQTTEFNKTDVELMNHLKLKNFGGYIITAGRVINPMSSNSTIGESEFVKTTNDVMFLPPTENGAINWEKEATTTYITVEWRIKKENARNARFLQVNKDGEAWNYVTKDKNDNQRIATEFEEGLTLDKSKTLSMKMLVDNKKLGGEYREENGYIYYKSLVQVDETAAYTENPSRFNAMYQSALIDQRLSKNRDEKIKDNVRQSYGTKIK